jgi:regulator of protease activity HflC (stomatin/prohibitin superfamily)
MNSLLVKSIAGVVSALILIVLVLSFWPLHSVPPGAVGIVQVFGKVQDEPLQPGLHFVGFVARVEDFNVKFQSAVAPKAEGATSDLQEVFEDISLNYEYDPTHATYVYSHFGAPEVIEQNFILPALYESFKAVTSQYTAEELVTKRTVVSSAIIAKVQTKLSKYHIIVSDINVQNFKFDDRFAEAVRNKVVAGQNRLTAEQNLETAKISTEQRVVEAEGQAKAIAIQSAAVQDQGGDKYIALEAIKKWNGELPTYMGGNGPLPFLSVGAH